MEWSRFHEIAEKLKTKYSSSDPFELCSAMGVHVRYADIGSLKGMYKYIKRNYFVLINSSLDRYIARIVCCHELCHHILHRDIARNIGVWDNMLYDMSGRIEQEANLLAAEIMISDDELLEAACDGRTVEQVAAELEADKHVVMLKAMSMQGRGYKLNSEFDVKSDYLGNL